MSGRGAETGSRDGGFPPIAALLPHAGAARLLDAVLSHDAAGTRCAVRPAKSALFRDASGRVPCWVAIEYMAQCAAVDGSLRLRARGAGLEPALFVGSRRVAFHCEAFAADARLEVRARHAAGRPGRLLAFDCAVASVEDGAILAEGRLNVLPGGLAGAGDA